MKTISEGRYEVFTSKADAIGKFRKLQGVCREKINGDGAIQFYCSKKGKITITNPPRRHVENDNSTDLFAEITEQDGKTYVTYYTAFSKANNVLKVVSCAVCLLLEGVFAALSIAGEKNITYFLLFPALALGFFIVKLFAAVNEKKNSSKDSEIMIRELEKRVEAVNLWDK